VTHLRKMMLEELQRRNYAETTIDCYIRAVEEFSRHFNCSPDRLRASEVCGIKLADLDLKGGSISIRRLKGSLHTVQPLYQHRGQPLLDEAAAIRAWLRKRVADGSDYLFTSQKGGKLSRIQFFRNFQKVAEEAGLSPEKRHPHVLKHSLASHLVAGNANLALIRQALGHRSINSTVAYIGTSDTQAAEALQKALMGIF
jgi:type 1 fimbriae regulatory protein FimB